MSPPRETIHVAFTADGNYAMPLAVAICSAATNCDKSRQLLFHVFHDDFSLALQAKVERSLQRSSAPNARIVWRGLELAAVADHAVVHGYMNHLIYARLLVPDLLPDDMAKVLYLDSDVVVLGDLAELWDTDVSQKPLFAVRDRIGSVSSPGGLLNWESLGMPPDAKYFNSGVLLMNLDQWRDRRLGEQVLKYLQTNARFIQMGDQDGLNAILFNNWGELAFRWNWQVVPDRARAMQHGCWGLDQLEKSIVHYVTSVKPWLPACSYEEKRQFYTYLDNTAWAGWRVPLWKETQVRLKRSLKSILAGFL